MNMIVSPDTLSLTMHDTLMNWVGESKRIIALEGPDGVGKTYQASTLFALLASIGIKVKVQRQPDLFRRTIFSSSISEEERVVLLLADYKLNIAKFLDEDYNLLILDRIPAVSLFAYNIEYIQSEWRKYIENMIVFHSVNDLMPDAIFVLNRPSFRDIDETLFEQRNKPEKVYEFYQKFDLLYLKNYIKIYKFLQDNATRGEVTDTILDYLVEVARKEGF